LEGNDTLIGGQGNDVLNGGAGADRYVFQPNPLDNGVDTIMQSGFTPGGVGGDILDFRQVTDLFQNGNVLPVNDVSNLGPVGPQNNGVIVLKQDAVGTADNLEALLDTTPLDDVMGNRVVVWEMNDTNVGVGIVSNSTPGGDDVSVNQVATITGFADQAEVDNFTQSLTVDNFDIV